MSKISLKSSSSGTATFTIESPATNTDRVLVLPDAGGTLVTTESISSEALTKEFPMASGGSLTTGKAVSLTNTGEVGLYPVLNTLGTERENATDTSGYAAISTNGTRAIRAAVTSGGGFKQTSVTFTVTGIALSSASNAIVGGTTQTVTLALDSSLGNVDSGTSFAPMNNDTFVCVTAWTTFSSNGFGRNIFKIVAFSVDGSGNVTKGNEITRGRFDATATGGPFQIGRVINPIDATKVLVQVNGYSTGFTAEPRFSSLTLSGTTLTAEVLNEGPEGASFIGGVNTLTTSNKIVNFNGTSYRIGTWNDGIETSVTTTSLVTDLFAGASIFWGVLDPTRAVAIYKNTSESVELVTYNITASTGVVTKVDDLVLLTDAVTVVYKDVFFAAKSATEFVYTYRLSTDLGFLNSAELDGSGNILGTNVDTANGVLVTTPRHNSGDVFFMNFFLGRQRLRPYTVNAYATPAFSYIGISAQTTSGATGEVVVAGIAGGMSGLTPNTLFFSAFNGDITASPATGVLVGKAVSTTEILLGAT